MIQTVIRSIPFRIIKNGKPGKAIGKRCCRQWLPVSRLNHVIGNADTTARTAFLFLTVFSFRFPTYRKAVKAKRGLEQPRSLYVKAAPVPDKQSKMAKSSLNNLNRDLKTKTAERKLERQPEVIESKYKSNMQRRPWEKSQAFFFYRSFYQSFITAAAANYSSSMIAISAASPRRGPSLVILV